MEHGIYTFQNCEEAYCRICLDSSEPESLLSPCKCSGTGQFVHHACLKIWLLNKYPELNEPVCEICKSKFSIGVDISSGLFCPDKEHWKNATVFPLLFIIFLAIVYIICSLIEKYPRTTSPAFKILIILLEAICLFSAMIVVIFLVATIKEFCFRKRVRNLIIYDYDILSSNRLDGARNLSIANLNEDNHSFRRLNIQSIDEDI